MPNPRKNLKGQRFGLLTVVALARSDKQGNTRWQCLCDCGKTTTVRYGHLTTDWVRSCGCLRKSKGRSMDILASSTGFWD
jgi:hypothetical protein